MKEDKKFKPDQKPFKENRICSFYKVTDENGKRFDAKFFMQSKIEQLNMLQATEYNQSVLSDLSDQVFPEQFLQIKYTYAIPEGFIFVTEQYEQTLETYLKSKVIEQKQALKIFSQVTKAIYSLYNAGFWSRNVRPQHFVKVKDVWKLESLVINQNIQEAEGYDSQYLWNSAYQPPEAYQRNNFEQEELDEMIVWNAGSLLVDLLLSHHKLKDQAILKRYKGQPFSFRAIGVKKKFSTNLEDILAKMLHYDPKKRMTYKEYFSSDFLCPEVAKISNSKDAPQINKKIYIPGQSSISRSVTGAQERNQNNLTISVQGWNKKRSDLQKSLNDSFRMSTDKIASPQQLRNTIKRITKNNIQITHQFGSIAECNEQSSMSQNNSTRQQQMQEMLMNPRINKAIEVYKSYFDKCQLLLISIQKLQKVPMDQNQVEAILLQKFALTFNALMSLHALAESMNKNLNFFELEDELWSDFQGSYEFRAFKQIVNFRRHQTKTLVTPAKQRLLMLKNERRMLNKDQIQEFVHANYKTTIFQQIKSPYRKILKKSYDTVSKTYNRTKSDEHASIGMYVTYCMAIDKMYISEHMEQNFSYFFDWLKVAPSNYVPLDKFQDYLDNANRKILVRHSSFILSKYFHV